MVGVRRIVAKCRRPLTLWGVGAECPSQPACYLSAYQPSDIATVDAALDKRVGGGELSALSLPRIARGARGQEQEENKHIIFNPHNLSIPDQDLFRTLQ